jgi:hypothetical protein
MTDLTPRQPPVDPALAFIRAPAPMPNSLPYEHWGNITSLDPPHGRHNGGFDIAVVGGPWPSNTFGWQWRCGTYVVPYTILDASHLILHVPVGVQIWWQGHTTVMNERQQPGDTLGWHTFTGYVEDSLVTLEPSDGPPAGGYPLDVWGHDIQPQTSEIVVTDDAGAETLGVISASYDHAHFDAMPAHSPGPSTVRLYLQTYVPRVAIAEIVFTYWPSGTRPPLIPLPPGRPAWRLTLHDRAFADNQSPTEDLFIAEITQARSVRLEQPLNGSATLTFTVDGFSPAAPLIRELVTDVMAWRWDEQVGRDVPMFRGIVAQSQDTVTEQADTVTFTCHDYLAMLKRRLLTRNLNVRLDQDEIAEDLITLGKVVSTSAGVSLQPGSYLPIAYLRVTPAGASRGPSGVVRDRSYPAQQDVGEALDNLRAVINGFDVDVVPGYQINLAWHDDQVRIWYPRRGEDRPDVILEFGTSVRALSRSVNSADYANYVRAVGNNGASDPNAAQLYAEQQDATANDVARHPQGLWMTGENDSDVSVLATLQEHADGLLQTASLLKPTYSLTLRAGFYLWGRPRLGDSVRLIVRSGRLDVDDSVRVVGITYVWGEDGGEDIEITVGRSDASFAQLVTGSSRDLDALARR